MKFKLNKLLIAKLGIAHAINSRMMYNNLKNDEYARKETTLLGKRALRHILTFLLFWGLAIFSIFKVFEYARSYQILMMILFIVIAIYLVAYGILFLPLALNLTIKQLKLNKRAIGWIDLTLFILAIIGLIALVLILKFS